MLGVLDEEEADFGASNESNNEAEDRLRMLAAISPLSALELEVEVEPPLMARPESSPERQDLPGPSQEDSSDWEPHSAPAATSSSESEGDGDGGALRLGRAGARGQGRAGRGRAIVRIGRGGRGRGGRGRGGRGRGGRGGRSGRSDWVRGQPLVERYPTDEDLPADLRGDLGRLEADRARRERDARARRAVLGDVVDEEEEVFYDCGDFVWEPMGDWSGTKENFLPERTGPTSYFGNAYDAFRAYWDDDIISQIVLESNRYAQGIRGEKFRRQWFDTSVDEILILLAFWMMLGIIQMPSIKSCFSKIPMMRTDIFRHLLTEDRYWNLNRAFHLAEGSRNPNNPEDLLYPMGNVIPHLNSKFKEHYIMEQEICIDESLTLWKGALKFLQYIKTKAARFGIKLYQLCESKTGYCWSFFVYVGHQSTSDSTLPSSVNFVLKLVRPILNLGHVLYMDNWFNSPQLARYLKRRATDCVGTLRANRKNVPAVLQKAALEEGEFVARQSGDVAVVALQDRKRLNLLSTCHNTAQVEKEARPGRPAQHKLQLVEDYNRGMGGVDRLDQMLEPYLVERKQCKKWTKKLFKRFLNASIQNARILYEKSIGSKVDSLVFRMALVKQIMDKHLPNVSRPQRVSVPSQAPLRRLTERHFVRRIPITDEMRARTVHKSNLGRAKCVWCRQCGRTEIKTVYHCPSCEVALCLDRGCFEMYHTVAEPGPEHMV